MLRRKNNFILLILVLSDIASGVLGFSSGYLLRNEGIFRIYLESVQAIEVYLLVLPIVLSLLILNFYLLGLYEIRVRKTQFVEMYTILRATTLWILLIMAFSYLSKYDYSRIIMLLFYFLTTLFVILGRLFIRNLQLEGKIGFKIKVAVVGDGTRALEIAKKITSDENSGFYFVGFVSERGSSKNWLGKVADLPLIIKKYQIDEVYVTRGRFSQEEILDLVAKCFKTPCKFKIVSNIFGLLMGTVDFFNLEAVPSLDLNKVYLSRIQKFYKRSMDLCFSIIGIILFSPLALLLILAIKMESSGPAVISQKRAGEGGKIFRMYKFRTMWTKTKLYEKAPRRSDDQRVTPLGRLLRRTSLDELPQLLNIFKGEMSLVGPRPEMPFIVKKYKQWERSRLLVKPGLTGLWQVLGRKDLPLSQNLEYDFYYINNQSIILDLTIILRTIPVILRGEGAY